MSQDIRRELISRNLGIIPINHGQVYTFQIALPASDQQEIPLERFQAIESSLLHHKSNLVSLILRRTKDEADDEIEYEVVHGADWLQVAKALDIEKLWAWVFDMTQEQALAAKAEFSELFNTAIPSATAVPDLGDSGNLEQLIDRKLQLATNSIKQVLASSLEQLQATVDEKLKAIQYRLDPLAGGFTELSQFTAQIADLQEQLKSVGSKSRRLPLFEGEKINLQTAQKSEISEILRRVGTQEKQVNAALNAIAYWQQPGKTLTWENLERSTKSKEHKVEGFAQGTFDRLKRVGEIPTDG
jgi:hypothetical protein